MELNFFKEKGKMLVFLLIFSFSVGFNFDMNYAGSKKFGEQLVTGEYCTGSFIVLNSNNDDVQLVVCSHFNIYENN